MLSFVINAYSRDPKNRAFGVVSAPGQLVGGVTGLGLPYPWCFGNTKIWAVERCSHTTAEDYFCGIIFFHLTFNKLLHCAVELLLVRVDTKSFVRTTSSNCFIILSK